MPPQFFVAMLMRICLLALWLGEETYRANVLQLHPFVAHLCLLIFLPNILGLDPYHRPLGDVPYVLLRRQLQDRMHPY